MNPSARPQFFDGQVVGADDLEAIVAHGSARGREHLLAHHAWGIAVGLEVLERPRPDGSVEAWVQPGYGVDGYGRTLVVRAPVPVTLDRFKGLPSGAWFVWLAYREEPRRAGRPAYGLCEGEDVSLRVLEGCEVRVTGSLRLDEREGGLALGGATRPDARLARRVFDPAGPFLPDGSVPEQGPPPAGARSPWLLPLGLVGWDAAAGALRPLNEPERLGARLLRRHVGTVAESLLAPGGLIRLRARLVHAPGATDADVDAIAARRALAAEDLTAEGGPLRPRDLVWVEGHMRVFGDARLLGGRLDLRAPDGAEPRGPLFLRRRATAANGPQSLDVALGGPPPADGGNRLVVGPLKDPTAEDSAVTPVFTVRADGRVGIGTDAPALALDVRGDFGRLDGPAAVHLKGSRIGDAGDDRLVVTSGGRAIVLGEAGHRVGINAPEPDPSLALEVKGEVGLTAGPAALRLLGSVLRDGGDGVLRIRSGGDRVVFDGADRVGIGTAQPWEGLRLDVSGGFGSSQGPAFMRLMGSELRDAGDGVLRIASGGDRVAFAAGDRVGVGTDAPTVPLDVNGDARVRGNLAANGDLSVGGDLTVNGIPWPGPSDARLKTGIETLAGALDTLLSLRGVSFRWRDPEARGAGRQIGMIADEVEAVVPGWVSPGPDGYKRLHPQGFEGLAVEAIRQLAARVEALEATVARLEAERDRRGAAS